MTKIYMTHGEVMREISAILQSPDPQARADALLAKLDGPHARSNIGYLAGYFSSCEAQEIYRLFKTSHPIFGTTNPSPEEALLRGRQIGEEMRDRR